MSPNCQRGGGAAQAAYCWKVSKGEYTEKTSLATSSVADDDELPGGLRLAGGVVERIRQTVWNAASQCGREPKNRYDKSSRPNSKNCVRVDKKVDMGACT